MIIFWQENKAPVLFQEIKTASFSDYILVVIRQKAVIN